MARFLYRSFLEHSKNQHVVWATLSKMAAICPDVRVMLSVQRIHPIQLVYLLEQMTAWSEYLEKNTRRKDTDIVPQKKLPK